MLQIALAHGECPMFAVIYQNTAGFNQNTIISIGMKVSLLNNKFESSQLG